MKKPIFIQNIPIDEKRIAFIERVVARLARHSPKAAKAMITPFPISNGIAREDIKGDILRYMFPASGTITRGAIALDAKPKEGVIVGISINNDLGSNSKNYVVNRKNLLFEPNLAVVTWDKLTVSIEPVGESIVNEVWVAFSWTPEIKDVDVKSFLIDDLEDSLNVL